MVLMPSGRGELGHGAHHGHGADGEDEVDVAARLDQLVELFRHQARLAIAAVVGHDVGFGAGGADLVFEDHHFAAACAFDEDDMVIGVFEGLGGGQRHGRAHAAGHDRDRAVEFDLGGVAEGTDDVENAVAGLEAIEQRCGLADGLHGEGHGSGGGIGAFDGERNALATLAQADDDELSGALLASDARRLDGELPDFEADVAGFPRSYTCVPDSVPGMKPPGRPARFSWTRNGTQEGTRTLGGRPTPVK